MSVALTSLQLRPHPLRSVIRFSLNRPLLVSAQMCVKPRNWNVSGLPRPCARLRSAANRPNSIRRVFSALSSKQNCASLSRRSAQNRQRIAPILEPHHEVIGLCRVSRYAESPLLGRRFSLLYATSDRRWLGIIPVVPEYHRCAEPAGSGGRPRTDRNAHARRPYPEKAPTDGRSGQHGVWRRRTVGPHSVPGPGAPERSRSQSRRRIMPSIPSPRPRRIQQFQH